jgi:ribosomal protein L34E
MPELRRDDAQREPAPARCARCGAPFRCGIDDAGGCWCAKLPPLPREVYAEGAGCMCEKCLRRSSGED